MVRSPTPSIPLRMVGGHPLPANGMRPPPSPSYESAPYSFKLRVPPRLCPARQLDSSPATNTGGVQSARYQPHSPFPHPSTSEVHHTISRADRAPSRPHRDYHPNREFETNIPGLDLREVQHIKTRTKAPSSGVQNHHHQSQRHIHSYSRSHRPCDNIDHKIKDPVPMYGVALVDDRGGVEFLATDRMDDWLAGVENDDFIIYEDPVEHGPDKNDTELSGAEPQTDESGLASTVVRYAMMEIEDGGDSDKENQNDAPKYRRIRKPTPIKPTILKEIKLNQVKTEIVKEDDAKTIWPKVDDSMLSVLKRRSIKRHADSQADTLEPPASKRSKLTNTLKRGLSKMSLRSIRSSRASKRAGTPSVGTREALSRLSSWSWVPGSEKLRSVSGSSGQERKIKICLVGDANAGKTALANRLVSGEFVEDKISDVTSQHSPITDHQIPTAPSSHATDYHSFSIIADDGKLVTIELWDFPGNIANERTTQLASNFFQAAIICYSVEDVKNIPSICDTWKPKLDRSLIDCPRFLLGLKKDLRPAFPPLGLSFLPRKEPVMADMGRSAAYHSRVAGYGECSAKTGENVDDAFRGIVNFTLSHMRKKEIGIAHGKRRDKAKETVKDAGKVMVDALCGFPNGPTPGRAWSRHL
ncbi:P-loop containing nucleoside triphosphate hydrolase protein [Neurospora crassa]|uniref:P-loop containing nucleoside triphosphate hydrolase protein n=1 Tax=Neurospora crassa (strain ATCC 24698 / 74-OR23-1A / CBS 708.71 / DSM 1257 / FGSC 987) TaxID=367110 RepID=V5IPS6_NEUCR|nr:hypothetical protein NCU03346 [Neurospora crassa OR74A]ESA43519.1 hypothetical protein NCU03346 [Neurospora crassa OR74A]KHE81192.1 P-loop containing nucleoside triphosphate hydrolase protein [Neurospora crassa]|eukprot:XP_011393528.1 hypothetical protein NCU03346 [Neurospora crassa OR74A]